MGESNDVAVQQLTVRDPTDKGLDIYLALHMP